MRISFAWWNTSLSPLAKPRATPEQKSLAWSVIEYLTKHAKIDCLALGEITAEEVNEFINTGQLNDYEFYDGTFKSGRLRFDTGVLYRKEMLHLENAHNIISSRGAHNLKVANRIDFLTPYSDRLLHLFVSHWPSRLWRAKNGADRHVLGLRLRDEIEGINKYYGGIADVILLGDYNDEPFDVSLSEQLLASRDRRLVRKNPDLLYNPFWRLLGESAPQVPGKNNQSFCGSYYYASGRETQWHTFDQIIFSASFLGLGDWHLNEEYTMILPLHELGLAFANKNEIFDHFPILSVIEREESDD
ncbi:MAG: endonuclease/exonuclease/phosphatase family protein [candidate division Zixibacteria bacterium]|nr:endonuclease/exonuclease/phosphatase family protein [Candidatus Tariuqbacter arcticus]